MILVSTLAALILVSGLSLRIAIGVISLIVDYRDDIPRWEDELRNYSTVRRVKMNFKIDVRSIIANTKTSIAGLVVLLLALVDLLNLTNQTLDELVVPIALLVSAIQGFLSRDSNVSSEESGKS